MSMTKQMQDVLDKFLAEKTILDVDRNTYLVCNLEDKPNKLTISLIFMKDWDSLEVDDYSCLYITNKGAVVTLPCYWVSVPKELAMGFFEHLIWTLYDEKFNSWISSNNTSTGNNGTSGSLPDSSTGCPGFIPICPPSSTGCPPPVPPCAVNV